MQSSSQIITTNKSTSSFLRAGCLSCRPTNSVKALKGKSDNTQLTHINSVDDVSDADEFRVERKSSAGSCQRYTCCQQAGLFLHLRLNVVHAGGTRHTTYLNNKHTHGRLHSSDGKPVTECRAILFFTAARVLEGDSSNKWNYEMCAYYLHLAPVKPSPPAYRHSVFLQATYLNTKHTFLTPDCFCVEHPSRWHITNIQHTKITECKSNRPEGRQIHVDCVRPTPVTKRRS